LQKFRFIKIFIVLGATGDPPLFLPQYVIKYVGTKDYPPTTMEKTKEQLEARKAEILAFLSKHYENDPEKKDNFTTRYPDFSQTDLNMDPSSEVFEETEYETQLAIEQALEDELLEIESQLEDVA